MRGVNRYIHAYFPRIDAELLVQDLRQRAEGGALEDGGQLGGVDLYAWYPHTLLISPKEATKPRTRCIA
jgi:hypothetical protein